jgi:DNA polymerase III epsilon subunit-like protein
MYFLFIDTETTGLPPYEPNVYPKRLISTKNSASWNACRLVQIAWQVYDSHYNLVAKQQHIIHPDNPRFPFTIPTTSSNIHGITHKYAVECGTSIELVLDELDRVVQRSSLFIAHNVKFDINVLRSEAYRYQYQGLYKRLTDIPKFCTLLTYSPKRGKFIKLSDLYVQLFGALPNVCLHQADVDVQLCAEVYMYMNPLTHPLTNSTLIGVG